ncbi:MAG: BMP family ABC transporter substrate-binding protein [Anaerolineae bacterium]|nr:BMP family ABC transporter substrate-binding protein [Anaerolineae bacterium]
MTTHLFMFLVMTLIAMILSACTSTPNPTSTEEATPATEEPPETTATSEPVETPDAAPLGNRYGLVTDAGGLEDNPFNALIWQGMEQAAEEFDVEVEYLTSDDEADYADNIGKFVGEGYHGVVTVGFLMAEATETAADVFSDVPFVIVDFPGREDNILGIQFEVDQASFLAGYLAAGMSQTEIICAYGGIRVEPITQYLVGFEQGVAYYNQQNNAEVRLLGWKTSNLIEGGGDGVFTNDFENTETGRFFAENFFEEGCDIIFPVAGQTGLGSAAAAQERNLAVIGVDIDQFEAAPELSDVYLTSILKQADVAVFEAIAAIEDGTFQGGMTYEGTLANEGVALAPFHDYDDAVPSELKDEIDQVRQDLINEEITTGWPVPRATPTPEPTSESESETEEDGDSQ